jgi:Mn-dependent DtxR family transcriptional regulator
MGKSDWLDALGAVLTKEADVVPKGWLDTRQVAQKMQVSPQSANLVIRKLLKHGMAEKRQFRRVTKRGLKPIPFYRLKK